MTIPNDYGPLHEEPVSSLLVKTLLSAFSLLTALSIRDSITQSLTVLTPDDIPKRLAFTVSLTAFFLFITVLVAYMWQGKIE